MSDKTVPTLAGSFTRRSLLLSGALMGVTACSQQTEPRTSWARGDNILPAGEVWAHMVPQGLPLSQDHDVIYGAERPLGYAPANAQYHELVLAQIELAKKSGLTGMQILLLEGINSGEDFMRDWLVAAEQVDTGQFFVAPCLQVRTTTGTTQLVHEYARVAERYSSAARIDEQLVVWVYDAPALPPTQWIQVRQSLEKDGIHTFMISELRTAASQHGDSFSSSSIDPYSGIFEAVWLFDDRDYLIRQDLASWAHDHRTAFAGGMMPGYNRGTERGGFTDAQGTALWRQQWEWQLKHGHDWATVVTWNDLVEHTAVQPTSDWGSTRADLTAHYASRFKGESLNAQSATAYVTTPQYLLTGDALLAEGLVINETNQAVSVKVRVMGPNEHELFASDGFICPAHEVTAVQVEQELALVAGDVAYCHVELSGPLEGHTQQTRSAPVLVYTPGDLAVPQPPRRVYYSVSSAASVRFEDVAMLRSTTQSDGSTSLQVSTHQPVRSLEFLHNTWPAGLALEDVHLKFQDPPESIVGGQKIVTSKHGFTVARVVTTEGDIAYSHPLWRSAEVSS